MLLTILRIVRYVFQYNHEPCCDNRLSKLSYLIWYIIRIMFNRCWFIVILSLIQQFSYDPSGYISYDITLITYHATDICHFQEKIMAVFGFLISWCLLCPFCDFDQHSSQVSPMPTSKGSFAPSGWLGERARPISSIPIASTRRSRSCRKIGGNKSGGFEGESRLRKNSNEFNIV